MEGSLLLLLAVFGSGVFAQGIIPRGPGESVTVRCEYAEKYRNSNKTWCRETDHGKCNRILTTTVTDEKRVLITSGDTILSDDKINRVMSVTVRNLREEDSGHYWCGIYNRDEKKMKSLKKPELQVSRGLYLQTISRGPGESLVVQCEYSGNYTDYNKTWCKERKKRCDPIVTAPYTASSGRTTIQDDKERHVISVGVGDLSEEDSGEYWCAVAVSTSLKIIKRIQLQVSEGVFSQVIIPRGPGESLIVRCKYGAKYISNSKTWCREEEDGTCVDIVMTIATDSTSVTRTSGRTTIWDDKITREIAVTVQDLREEDSGRYWCGVDFPDENEVDTLKTTELQVSRGLHAEVVPRVAGESLAVQCEYPENYTDYEKVWCRDRNDRCEPTVTAPGRASSGRTTMHEDKQTRVLSITVQNLQEVDKGEYWCAANVKDSLKIMKRVLVPSPSEVRIPSVTTSSADKHSPTVTMGYIQGEAMNASAASPRNCTSRYVVCVSDPKVMALVSIVLVNKVLMVAGLYVALRRSAGRKKAHRRTYY